MSRHRREPGTRCGCFYQQCRHHNDIPATRSRRAHWTIDPKAKTARLEILDDLTIEFPTVNLARTGQFSRYSYAVGFPGNGLKTFAIVKYDGRDGRSGILECPSHVMPSEPCFVADPQGAAEDHGWLLTYVSDISSGNSAELWILDASDLGKPPVAAIEIPHWVPAGVHGSWIDDKAIT